jgi:hypothetical protein
VLHHALANSAIPSSNATCGVQPSCSRNRDESIDYWDDTGFTADGTFVSENELHHGGMIFRRER